MVRMLRNSKMRIYFAILLAAVTAILFHGNGVADDGDPEPYYKQEIASSCVYTSPWCNWVPLLAGWGYNYDATWTCLYDVVGNKGYLNSGPFDYNCSIYNSGCCTMPKSATCAPAECDEVVPYPFP